MSELGGTGCFGNSQRPLLAEQLLSEIIPIS